MWKLSHNDAGRNSGNDEERGSSKLSLNDEESGRWKLATMRNTASGNLSLNDVEHRWSKLWQRRGTRQFETVPQ